MRPQISVKSNVLTQAEKSFTEGQLHSHSMDVPELSIEQQGFGLGM